jgi:hypothetical protein
MTKCLEFTSNDSGEEEGLNHPGVETFSNALYESLARECGQNSADAHQARPVRLSFDLLYIPTADLPGHDRLCGALRACLRKVDGVRGKQREIEFFRRAIGLTEQPKLCVLRISDVNTTGLVGPCTAGTPFHSLVKADGVSSKQSDDAGGSFGIGKYATFAASGLRTVFFTTTYCDEDGATRFLAQGKSLLMSHEIDGREYRRTAYWGRRGFKPVDSLGDVPRWMRRDNVGTSLFVAGFDARDGWLPRMRAAVAQNFLWAIQRGDLEISLREGPEAREVVLDAGSLAESFEDPGVLDAVSSAGRQESFEFAKGLYRCLTDESAVQSDLEVLGIGNVRMRILVSEGLPKRVMIVRNGMAITDSLKNFGDHLERFRGFRDFVAFVEPMETEGRRLIRSLENSRHDELSDERIVDDGPRSAAKRAMKALREAIRDSLKKHALAPISDRMELDEMAEFFATEDPSQRDRRDNVEEDLTVPTVAVTERKPFPRPSNDRGDGAGDQGGGGSGRNQRPPRAGPSRPGPNRGGGSGGKGKRAPRGEIAISSHRNMLLGPSRRRVQFTPEESGRGILVVYASGIDSEAVIAVTGSSSGPVKGGYLPLDCEAGKSITVDVTLCVDYSGPIELVMMKGDGDEGQ